MKKMVLHEMRFNPCKMRLNTGKLTKPEFWNFMSFPIFRMFGSIWHSVSEILSHINCPTSHQSAILHSFIFMIYQSTTRFINILVQMITIILLLQDRLSGEKILLSKDAVGYSPGINGDIRLLVCRKVTKAI